MPSDYESGTPDNDWFEVLYQESLYTSATSSTYAIPLKWTMLARNQIINAHTEHWVIRYLSYEAIDSQDEYKLWNDSQDEYKLWNDWNHLNFDRDCNDDTSVEVDEGHTLKMNRLGMFFSSSTGQTRSSNKAMSQFETFMALHNKQYSTDEEYYERKAIHDSNMNKIQQWNMEHAGKTLFTRNEFMDMEIEEVMKFRGGHIPMPHVVKAKRAAINKSKANPVKNKIRYLASDDDNYDAYNFTVYKVPDDFDASTLPKEFDWRTHMPESISPIKDQGFCGS
jgi:hypothetical protein